MVVQLFNKLPLNEAISVGDISTTYRLKPRAPNMPAPVIVRFTNRKARDAVYRARRHLKSVTAGGTQCSNPTAWHFSSRNVVGIVKTVRL